MSNNYTIKNGRQVRQVIDRALTYYQHLAADLYVMLLDDVSYKSYYAISKKLKELGYKLSPRSISKTIFNHATSYGGVFSNSSTNDGATANHKSSK